MSGGEIHCGSFHGEEKSGSAFEGVVEAISEQAPELAEALMSSLEEGEYVLISEEQAAELGPLLRSYRAELVADIGHDRWFEETKAEEAAGLDAVAAKWGEGRGWRLYCVTNLIGACEASLAQHQEICIAFS